MDRSAIIEKLCSDNFEFKRIHDKHQSYEKELEGFQNRLHLSTEEELKAKTIKKNKLLLKDKMAVYINRYGNDS
jgi:uncharacterized protein YdcH (DUF465 family)